MAKTFQEYAKKRRANLSENDRKLLEAFNVYYEVGAAVAMARKARHMTQTELSSRCGIAQAEISKIERGDVAPTAPTLFKLTDALGVRIHFEVTNDEPPCVKNQVLLTHQG